MCNWENGPRTMQQIYHEGPAKMQAAEFDVRLSRRPIERCQWPLGATCSRSRYRSGLASANERAKPCTSPAPAKIATATAALLILCFHDAFATAPGLQL